MIVVFPDHAHFLSLNECQQTTKMHAKISSRQRVKVHYLVIMISKMYKICNPCIKQVSCTDLEGGGGGRTGGPDPPEKSQKYRVS